MSRSKLLHVPDGYYYIRLEANTGQKIVHDSSDVATLENCIQAALRRTQANLLAYCISESDIRLAVQIGDVSVSQLVQFIASPYSGRVHRKRHQRGTLFQRNRTALIANDAYLLRVVRLIHQAADEAKHSATAEHLVRSSNDAYAGGKTEAPWLTTATVLNILKRRAGEPRQAYRKFMSEPVTEEDRTRIETTARCIPPAAESHHRSRVAVLHSERAAALSSDSLDALIVAVARWFGVAPAQLLSRSRSRYLTCARALVAWHASRSGIATLEDVAKRVHRNRSSLSAALYRYSEEWPSIFNQPIGDLITNGSAPPRVLDSASSARQAA